MADGNQTIVGNDTTLLASTQTAVLLAELAAEGGNMTLPMNTTLNTTKLGLNKSVKISDSSSPETSSSCLSFRICGGDETLLGSQLGNVPLADASGFIVQKQVKCKWGKWIEFRILCFRCVYYFGGFFTPWPGVLSLPASVRPPVRPKIWVIDLDLQGHFDLEF